MARLSRLFVRETSPTGSSAGMINAAISVVHPFGMSGALYVVVTMCVGCGMGAAASVSPGPFLLHDLLELNFI